MVASMSVQYSHWLLGSTKPENSPSRPFLKTLRIWHLVLVWQTLWHLLQGEARIGISTT